MEDELDYGEGDGGQFGEGEVVMDWKVIEKRVSALMMWRRSGGNSSLTGPINLQISRMDENSKHLCRKS